MKRLALCGFLTLALAAGACSKEEKKDQGPETIKTDQPEVKQPVTISISCGAVGNELEICKEGAEAWAAKTGNKVKVVSTPNESSERLALYQTMLSAQGADIDVFQIDVIWPGILSNHLIDLKQYSKEAEDQHFAAIVENNTVNGKLVALPWFTDAGVLYYRKDLLEKHGVEVPETWDALTAAAKKIQDAERKAGAKDMWGFVWQGKAYEGLTCNAVEWVSSHGGGSIVDGEGKVTVNNPAAIAAIDMAAKWIGTISPKDVLNSAEEEARGVFQSGNAVFMRNWPYAWGLAQGEDSPIKDKVGVAALPKGGDEGRHAAALGGWQLAVSRYSRHQAEAADLVLYLTGAEEQKRRAIKGSYNPTIKSLYTDEEVLKANPFFASLYDTFVNAQPRPSTATGAKYNQVSNNFWNAVHEVLSGKKKAADSLGSLESELQRLSRGGNWK
jgi:trehalose/maltose transport system substrate-binding protein